ncbi:hypothetical protein [Actinokineospora xionganensis]|uniref:Lipoprotein antigen n=1 Tax=Actinokineospora xionganensis TaxID=2684470 RepID=A0ABR7KZB8_9PSEU|nr:hypothetical protein [Actinokineospora xionganensis]MBC6445781.1 hypothetical protein [Actinokineospora xionganensis]
MFKNTALAVLFAGGAVLGLTACGSETVPLSPTTQTQATQAKDKSAKDAETKAKDTPELKKDVKVVACKAGAHGGVSATLEVTNSLDEAMEYLGTIAFLDGTGAKVAEGLFNTGTLQPGEKSTEEIPGDIYTVVKGAKCEVAEVKLDEPV